jgi:hypothetical protein
MPEKPAPCDNRHRTCCIGSEPLHRGPMVMKWRVLVRIRRNPLWI